MLMVLVKQLERIDFTYRLRGRIAPWLPTDSLPCSYLTIYYRRSTVSLQSWHDRARNELMCNDLCLIQTANVYAVFVHAKYQYVISPQNVIWKIVQTRVLVIIFIILFNGRTKLLFSLNFFNYVRTMTIKIHKNSLQFTRWNFDQISSFLLTRLIYSQKLSTVSVRLTFVIQVN